MANTKIDSIKLAGSTETYDIDLPSTATPSIASLTTGSLSVTGSSNLMDVTCSNVTVMKSLLSPTISTITISSPDVAGVQSGLTLRATDNTISLDASIVTVPNVQINWDNGVYGSYITKLSRDTLSMVNTSGSGIIYTLPTMTGGMTRGCLPYVTNLTEANMTEQLAYCAKKSSSNTFTASNTFTGSVTVNNKLQVNGNVSISTPYDPQSVIEISNPAAGTITMSQGGIDLLGSNNTYISITDDPMVYIRGDIGVDVQSDAEIALSASTISLSAKGGAPSRISLYTDSGLITASGTMSITGTLSVTATLSARTIYEANYSASYGTVWNRPVTSVSKSSSIFGSVALRFGSTTAGLTTVSTIKNSFLRSTEFGNVSGQYNYFMVIPESPTGYGYIQSYYSTPANQGTTYYGSYSISGPCILYVPISSSVTAYIKNYSGTTSTISYQGGYDLAFKNLKFINLH